MFAKSCKPLDAFLSLFTQEWLLLSFPLAGGHLACFPSTGILPRNDEFWKHGVKRRYAVLTGSSAISFLKEFLFFFFFFLSGGHNTETYRKPVKIHEVFVYVYISLVGRLIVVNGSLLSLHSKQEHTKQSFFC